MGYRCPKGTSQLEEGWAVGIWDKREEGVHGHICTDLCREVFEFEVFEVFVDARTKVLLDGAVVHHSGWSSK